MSSEHDSTDYTLEAIGRLRRLLREHERSGAEDTPFHLGIRKALADFEAEAQSGERAAA